jgi:hypothetical protein
MTSTLAKLTNTRRSILGSTDNLEEGDDTPQADAGEFENVIASAIMQLTKTLENGLRIKASIGMTLSDDVRLI